MASVSLCCKSQCLKTSNITKNFGKFPDSVSTVMHLDLANARLLTSLFDHFDVIINNSFNSTEICHKDLHGDVRTETVLCIGQSIYCCMAA